MEEAVERSGQLRWNELTLSADAKSTRDYWAEIVSESDMSKSLLGQEASCEGPCFDHIGIITDEPQAAEVWHEGSMVWLTDPAAHPLHVEWVRFHADSPVSGAARSTSHVAFWVDELEAALKGYNVILPPTLTDDGTKRVAFIELGDVVVELMERQVGASPGAKASG